LPWHKPAATEQGIDIQAGSILDKEVSLSTRTGHRLSQNEREVATERYR
jgi:hypothetical protein